MLLSDVVIRYLHWPRIEVCYLYHMAYILKPCQTERDAYLWQDPIVTHEILAEKNRHKCAIFNHGYLILMPIPSAARTR